MANVWVGNLPNNYSESTLQSLFSKFGAITSCKVISRPQGSCGMVLFEDPVSASSAVAEMNQFQVEGAQLIVRLARDKKAAQAASLIASISPYGIQSGGTNVWVGNLPETTGEDELRALASSFGPVTSLKVLSDKATGQPSGAAMVNFANPQAALEAIMGLNGRMIPNATKPLILKLAMPKGAPKGPRPEPPVLAAMPRPTPMPPPAPGAAAMPAATTAPAAGNVGTPGGTNVWVGNLPRYYTEQNVGMLFSQCGQVMSCKVLLGKTTQQPEGAAMVNFSSPAGASAAVYQLNGSVLEPGGKPLVVRFANSQQAPSTSVAGPAMGGAGFPGNFFGGQPAGAGMQAGKGGAPVTNLWVGNLPPGFTDIDLYGLFSTYGTVTAARLMPDRSGRGQAALVNYSTPYEAAAAMQDINGWVLPGSGVALMVRPASKETHAKPAASQPAVDLTNATDNLWVGNVPTYYSDSDINALFSMCGNILSSTILPPKQPGQMAGAMVRFSTVTEAAAAIQALNGSPVDPTKPLIVKFASPNAGKPVRQAHPTGPQFHPYAW